MSEVLDAVFTMLEDSALRGLRCPQSGSVVFLRAGRQTTLSPAHTSALAREGRIRIEVFHPNWRVVTILKGPHAGKQTLAARDGLQPYLVIDTHGRRLNGRLLDSHERRQQPSPPRVIGARP